MNYQRKQTVTIDNEEKKDRRQFRRFPLKEKVVINGLTQAYTLNVSESGMFIFTLYSAEAGSIINLTIASQCTVKAEVKNCQPGIGLGVQFVDLSLDQKAKIKHFIEQLKNAAVKTRA